MNNLASMSGEQSYKSVQLPVYDIITLNGNEGKYYVQYRTKPKIKVKDLLGKETEQYEKKEVGTSIELVWLKLRRQLVEKTQEGVVRQSSEHNTKKDIVSIYHFNGGATQDGILASAINGDQGLYPKMKVNQIVYALSLKSGNIVKVLIKGGSLSMQEDLPNATLFFDYISSMEKDEHFYTMTNVMTATPYQTKLGIKSYSNFTKGRALTEEELKLVEEKMTEVHTKLSEYDAARPQKPATSVDALAVAAADKKITDAGITVPEMPSIDYDEGEAPNVDDIPF